jgi:hypothetical protein
VAVLAEDRPMREWRAGAGFVESVMLFKVPERFEREQRSVEAQIRDAFRGVAREGGTSWSESVIVDGDGSGRTREEARALDTERCWEDLVDDPAWDHEAGMGGFNFLDPIGYRYYIAPAMIRCVREGGGESVSFALDVSGDFKRGLGGLITPRQAHVIARFIRLMIAIHKAVGDDIYCESWSYAYRVYWRAWDRGTPLRETDG